MRFDPTSGVATFDYAVDGSTHHEFADVLKFPLPDRPLSPDTVARAWRVMELLFVAAGVSYYKLLCPPAIELPTVKLAPATRRWAVELYRQGLAQHAYRHDLPHVLELDLDDEPGADAVDLVDPSFGDRPPLVAVGGGKDSIVSIEALRAAGLDPTLFSISKTPLLAEVVALAQLPTLTVTRVMDSRAAPILKAGGYKGHAPVTALNALIGVVTSVLHGLGPAVLSNERSADAANLVWRGHQINHQWAKGAEAEDLMREAVRAHAGLPDASFSLLNGMSELHIAQLFSRFTAYDSKVTSCNNAFRLFAQRSERWCGRCDKCRFVFLALAPFMTRDRLVGIVGRDLLADPELVADPTHLDGFRELLGLTGHKPFECVGEITESRVALRLLAESPTWSAAPVVQALRAELHEWPSDQDVAEVFTSRPPRFAPHKYSDALADMQRSAISMPV
jgi:hypothetical protein